MSKLATQASWSAAVIGWEKLKATIARWRNGVLVAWVQRNAREIFLFTLGAGGFIHELLRTAPERPFLIAASLALMGLPFFLASDKLVSRKTGVQRRAEDAERNARRLASDNLDSSVAKDEEIRELRRRLRQLEGDK